MLLNKLLLDCSSVKVGHLCYSPLWTAPVSGCLWWRKDILCLLFCGRTSYISSLHTQVCALKVSQGPSSTLKYHFWHNSFFFKEWIEGIWMLAYTAWPSPPSPEASTVLWWELEPKSSWRPHYQGYQEYSPLVCHPLPAKAVLHVLQNAHSKAHF